MFVTMLLTINPTTFVYRFVVNKYLRNQIEIVQLFVMNILSLCVNLKFCIANIFYGWELFHCMFVTIC